MNAICNLLLNIDQNVEQWELNSHALGAAQLSRWKSGYERYVHSRRKLEFVLDSLTVTPPWNPLLIGAAAVSLFGHKVTDMLATAAAVMPGAHADDNAPIVAGKTIETSTNTPGFDGGNSATGIGLDVNAITQSNGQTRLGDGVGGDGALSSLVLETKNK